MTIPPAKLTEFKLTDLLTGKALVEKSYEYVSKLSRECAKSLVDEFNATHAKFKPESLSSEIALHVLKYFEKRDKGITFRFQPTSGGTVNNVSYLKFVGSTKDADFAFTAVVLTFTSADTESTAMTFVKSISFSVEKASFAKRKF